MNERVHILEMIEAGEINAEEGVRRLEALAKHAQPTEAQPIAPPAWVGRIWPAVFWSAVVLVLGGGLLVAGYYAWEAGVGSAICGWPLLIVGVLGSIVVLLRSARGEGTR